MTPFLKFPLILLAGSLLTACQPGLVAVKEQSLTQLNTDVSQLNQKLAQHLEQHDQDLTEQFNQQQQLTNNQLQQQENLIKTIDLKLEQLAHELNPNKNQESNTDTSQDQYKILNDKLIVGSVEKIHFTPSNWVFDARIDTGATTSSIDARQITEFERDGKNWVKFTLTNRALEQELKLEMPIKRTVSVSQASVKTASKRLVVEFLIKIGNLELLTDFTLNDRDHMEYPVLVGRTLLRDLILVDVSQQYLAPLQLEETPAETVENNENIENPEDLKDLEVLETPKNQTTANKSSEKPAKNPTKTSNSNSKEQD